MLIPAFNLDHDLGAPKSSLSTQEVYSLREVLSSTWNDIVCGVGGHDLCLQSLSLQASESEAHQNIFGRRHLGILRVGLRAPARKAAPGDLAHEGPLIPGGDAVRHS